MPEDSHSKPKYNAGSPSSDQEVVAKIVSEFMKSPGAFALDIGGTKSGFIARLPTAPEGLRARIILVNIEGNEEIAWRSVAAVPVEPLYDLVMMFGTTMYMSRDELRQTFATAQSVLKPGGTFLVADVNGENPVSWFDLGLKILVRLFQVVMKIVANRRWRPVPSRVYPRFYIIRLLKSAGFSEIKSRRDLKARSGWHPLVRWTLYVIQPTRYYVLSAVKAPTSSDAAEDVSATAVPARQRDRQALPVVIPEAANGHRRIHRQTATSLLVAFYQFCHQSTGSLPAKGDMSSAWRSGRFGAES